MSKEVKTIVRYSPKQIRSILKACWAAKEPFNLTGEPSTVKSAFIAQGSNDLAQELTRKHLDWNRATYEEKLRAVEHPEEVFVYADLRAAETDIGDLRLQNMGNSEEFMTFRYNILFKQMSHPDAAGILFLDEMNLASNLTKGQFYKLINDHCIGDLPLSENVLVISAGNESEHSRNVTPDPVPLVLRRGNFFIRPLTHEEYNDYAVSTGHHQFVVGYLAFQPGDTHRIEFDLPDSVGQPAPRTWSKLSNVLLKNPKLKLDEIEMLATGFVGQATAMKFSAYVRAAQKIDLKSIIENPALFEQIDQEANLSVAYAVIAGVVDKWREDKKVLKPALELSLYAKRPELGAYVIRSVKAADEDKFMKAGRDEKLIPTELFDRVQKKYGRFLLKDEEGTDGTY